MDLWPRRENTINDQYVTIWTCTDLTREHTIGNVQTEMERSRWLKMAADAFERIRIKQSNLELFVLNQVLVRRMAAPGGGEPISWRGYRLPWRCNVTSSPHKRRIRQLYHYSGGENLVTSQELSAPERWKNKDNSRNSLSRFAINWISTYFPR